MLGFTTIVLASVWLNCIQSATAIHLGPLTVNLWKLNVDQQRSTQLPARSDDTQHMFEHGPGVTTLSKKYEFRAQWFEQPLDHFDKSSKHRVHQRYWVNSRHYKPRKGAPVIVLDGGETSGEVGFYQITRVAFPDLAS